MYFYGFFLIDLNDCLYLCFFNTFAWMLFTLFKFKPRLLCAISSTFTLHFMCWKYFDKCCMDKNLLQISLTKFNKLNKRRKRTFLTTQFKNKQNIKA